MTSGLAVGISDTWKPGVHGGAGATVCEPCAGARCCSAAASESTATAVADVGVAGDAVASAASLARAGGDGVTVADSGDAVAPEAVAAVGVRGDAAAIAGDEVPAWVGV